MYDKNNKHVQHSAKKMLSKHFYVEMFMLMLCPIPYYDWYVVFFAKKGIIVNYLASDFILAAMWSRIYFIVRAIFNYSIYTDAYSKKLC